MNELVHHQDRVVLRCAIPPHTHRVLAGEILLGRHPLACLNTTALLVLVSNSLREQYGMVLLGQDAGIAERAVSWSLYFFFYYIKVAPSPSTCNDGPHSASHTIFASQTLPCCEVASQTALISR